MGSGRRLWSEVEIENAISLYVELPFGRLHQHNPRIIELASQLGRTPSSVALKLVNLASIDETVDRKGMANASKLDHAVWDRFFDKLLNIGESLDLAEQPTLLTGMSENPQSEYLSNNNFETGKDILSVTSTRQGQQKFRKMIFANYNEKCAISGISQPELLIAGHISPWSKDSRNRLNPRNGILLNRLHDKAFEERLISFQDDGEILYSPKLRIDTREKLKRIDRDGYLELPNKFKPDPSLIRAHRENLFLG